jgi:hypothetical protein
MAIMSSTMHAAEHHSHNAKLRKQVASLRPFSKPGVLHNR